MPSKQANPTDTAPYEACLATAIFRFERTVSRAYNAALRPYDIKATQFILLAVIDQSGGRGGDIAAADLTDKLSIDQSTLSRNIARLEARGWLTQAEGASDGRRMQLQLTRAGRKLLKDAMPDWLPGAAQWFRITRWMTGSHMLSAVNKWRPNWRS